MAKWTDPNLIPPSGGGSYLKLKHGENKIRIVSEAEVFGKHFKNKKSTVCLGKEECDLCQEGDKPKPSWLMWVIDRTDGNLKMLEAGYQIISQIQKMAQSSEYGFEDLPNYDIIIQKEGEALETEYTVTPARKDTELTIEERKNISELKSPALIIEDKKKGVLKEPF